MEEEKEEEAALACTSSIYDILVWGATKGALRILLQTRQS
jgi:hypothetical protein